MIGLTRRQAECLSFIEQHMAANSGVAPSYDEMMMALGMKSRSGVHQTVHGLIERGYVRTLPFRARALEIIRPAPGDESADLASRLSRLNDDGFARVAKAVLAEGQRRAGGRA